VVGDNDTALLKQEIQRLVRLIVTHRDGGCVLRKVRCGVTAFVDENEEVVASSSYIQADHLISRANSATFADPRLIVCICNGCHAWKNWRKEEYDELVKSILPKDRVELWEKCEQDRHAHKTYKPDWNMAIVALKQELSTFST
jgi:hypothetical protein